MGIINIRPAKRDGARVVIGLAGVSGSGKTYSALQLAYGLAGYDAKKVGLLDTENKRGSLYSDILEKAAPRPTQERFMIGNLVGPFSPARYKEALLEFQATGVDVLVIDSVSHEWEGVGGCDEIANDGDPKVPRWNKAKREHRGFMNALLQCDMHIIACLRAREKVKMESRGGKVEVVPIGIQPVCEKNFLFELTASILMHDEGKRYDRIKVPAQLHDCLPGDGYITSVTGARIREWVHGGGQTDPRAEKWRNRLLTVAEEGMRAIEAAWDKVPDEIRTALGKSFYSELSASAKAFDDQRAIAASDEDKAAAVNARLNAPPATAPMGIPLEFK
jgi:hypothetical protein